jgi:hypothetical protein
VIEIPLHNEYYSGSLIMVADPERQLTHLFHHTPALLISPFVCILLAGMADWNSAMHFEYNHITML